ncbi:membrane protein [Weissella viridescens]|uniref:Membrane protein n=2 Tax=Weissella viridescens TaxID=1629 RepID=A0A0R2H8J4_WEIVI|nr:membrane protein [Weissella viridescens]
MLELMKTFYLNTYKFMKGSPMDQDYTNRLNRLDQLNTVEETVGHTPKRPHRRPQPIYTDKMFWVLMVVSVLSQLAIWWIYPLIYSKHLVGGPWQENPLLVFYSILLALATYLTFSYGLTSRINYLFILVPLAFIYILYQQMTVQQIILLILLPLSLFLINISWLNLQNILGLILYSGIATLSLPVVIFYQQNTFLTTPFLLSLLPLFLCYLYYMSSIFIPDGQNKRITSLIFGIILLINVLTLPWNFWTFLAIVVIVITWMVFINYDLKFKYRMGFLSFFEMITVLIIFLQQR